MENSSHSCLARSDPQEPANLQSVKNRIHNMIISLYAEGSRNVTSRRLGDINFQVIRELHSPDLIGRPTAPSQISSCKIIRLARWKFLRDKTL